MVPAAERRLERLAAFTFAATIAVTGCTLAGEEDTDQKEDELGAVQPMYGMPPAPAVDAGKDSGKDAGKDAAKDADVDAQDAAPPCPPPVNDDGGVFAMYGAPAFEPCPVPEEDAGAMQPMYGMPPSEPFEE